MSSNVGLVGFGPIGLEVSKTILLKESLKLIGIVDSDPNKQGDSLKTFFPEISSNIAISDSIKDISHADVAVVTTSSSVEKNMALIKQLLENKVHVISTCEELVFPSKKNNELIKELDTVARQHQCSLLATGVNPGFLMDYLPIILTGLCVSVDSIVVARIQNASQRRLPFQDKIGVGLSQDTFEKKLENDEIGHRGLLESAKLLMSALGYPVECIVEESFPILNQGCVEGIEQQIIISDTLSERVQLIFRASMIEKKDVNRICIKGNPDLNLEFNGPVPGDVCTASVIANMIPSLKKLKPGYSTMLDLIHLKAIT